MINKKQARTAPEFSVSDSEGRTVRLSDYRGKKNIILVFNRGFT
jgi:peroxiredoxin